MSYPYGYGGTPYGYGGGFGLNPYAYVQQLQQQMASMQAPQQPMSQPMSFNQWAQQQPYPSGKLQPYGPFTNPQSPASMYRMQQLQAQYGQMQPQGQQPPPAGQQPSAAGISNLMGGSMQAGGYAAGANLDRFRQPTQFRPFSPPVAPPSQPFGGQFASAFQQAQPFRPAPQTSMWSSQGPAMSPARNFSPLANEGYSQPAAPPPTMPNQFSAQNQTRGMGGGMNSGRPTFGGGNDLLSSRANRGSTLALDLSRPRFS